MINQISPKSLLEMARGAFLERFDYEVPRIAELEVKVGLAPTIPVKTFLYVYNNPDTGKMQVVEMVPEVPGQQIMDGGEQEPAAVLRLVNQEESHYVESCN